MEASHSYVLKFAVIYFNSDPRQSVHNVIKQVDVTERELGEGSRLSH